MSENFGAILPFFRCYLRGMQADVLIVGQGICGSLLSWFLAKEGKSFVVIDRAENASASRAAAGLVNPVTGRRYATSWMADEVMSFAKEIYREVEAALGLSLLYQRNIIDFFPSPEMRNSFIDRIAESNPYLRTFPDQNLFNPYFNYEFGCGEIYPALTVHLSAFLAAWRNRLQETGLLRDEHFSVDALTVSPDGVLYEDIGAEKVIFCDGIAGASNPWFQLLPFSANKGEALVISCSGLPADHVYKRGMLLVPLPEKNFFWFGSNYQWDFENGAPSPAFLKAAVDVLKQFLKLPFEVVEHKAAVRPATLERRPFVGFHPHFPAVGLLNGMGTKGASLAPYFAHQLVQHYVHGLPLLAEADVRRFSRILSK